MFGSYPMGQSSSSPLSSQPVFGQTNNATSNAFAPAVGFGSGIGTPTMPAFGQSSANPFSSSTSPHPFVPMNPVYGYSGVGSSSNSAFGSSHFGTSNTSNLFGSTSSATTSLFDSTDQAFGADTTSGYLFSSSGTSAFGSPSIFGSTYAQGTASAFGSGLNLGNSQSYPLFQSSAPALAQTSSPFGQTSSAFGQTASAFGQSSLFNLPSSGLGGNLYSSNSSLLSQSNPLGFGQTTSSLAVPFPSAQPAQSSGGFSFSNFGQQQSAGTSGFGAIPVIFAQSSSGQSSAFGSNPFGSQTPFGAPSQPAFGSSSIPAFDGTSTPAFGSTPSPAFGSTSGGFGLSSSPSRSSTPAFGATSTPAFGATSTPALGATSTIAFGATTAPAFGATTTPAFGATTTAFGASSAPAFGAASAPAFGASSAPAFGASSTPSNFGSSSTFGQSTPAFGSSPFNATSSFGAHSSFGGQTSNPAFGQSAFGGQRGGSRVSPYSPTPETDGAAGAQPGELESISAMPVYKKKSHEELRWEDYQLGDKGGLAPAGQSNASVGFVSGIGTSTALAFGQSSANHFSSSTSPNPFVPENPAFGDSGFGSSSTTGFGSSPIGASNTSSLFGSTSSATTSLFGSTGGQAFGANTTSPSLFSSSGTSAFGSPSIFGPTYAQGTASAFGSGLNLGNSQSYPLFQSSTPALAQTSSPFGQTSSAFGQTASAFGQSSLFNTPSSGFDGNLLSSNSSLLSQSNPLGFEQTTSSIAVPFPSAQPAQSSGGFSFSNFGQQQSAGTSGFGATPSIFGQSSFGQSSVPQSTVVAQAALITKPFGILPTMPQMSIGRLGTSPSIQYGISSLPSTVVAQAAPITNPFGILPPMPQMSIGRSGTSPSIQYGISSLTNIENPMPAKISSLITFGQSTFGGQQGGSKVFPYSPTPETGALAGIQSGKLVSISAMPIYKQKSHEELRWEDYELGDKGGQRLASAQSAFVGQLGGSRICPYSPTLEIYGAVGTQPRNVKFTAAMPVYKMKKATGKQPEKLESISAMSVFKGKSHEELRWEDYQLGIKGGPPFVGQPQSVVGFGSYILTSNGTAFGPSYAYHYSPLTPLDPFAPNTPIFGNSGFGSSSTSAFGCSPFGTSNTSNLFGSTSSPTTPLFCSYGQAFGANTTCPSHFSSCGTFAFGSPFYFWPHMGSVWLWPTYLNSAFSVLQI